MPDTRPDDWFPLEADEHARQVGALLARLMRRRERGGWVLDVGCGDGRVAGPVAETGVRVLAIDTDGDALGRCASACGPGVVTRRVDALDPDADFSLGAEPARAAYCLGHTFMLFHDVRVAASLLRRLRRVIAPGGWFAIDAFCRPLWADVADGLWQNGVSEDGAWQMVWAPGDNVLALRSAGEVDASDWTLRRDDRLMRLWSMGELTLLAETSGWGAPKEDETGSLIVFERGE